MPKQNYLVTWEADVEATSPREAAQAAWEMMRDPSSIATVFTVADEAGEPVLVDLHDEAGE